jgi:glycosyltransferase involved in cell wall biosynthesis
MRDIYFWEPEVSPHKLPLFHAASRSGLFGATYYIAEAQLSPDRIAQGWVPGIKEGDRLEISPSRARVREIIEQSAPDSVHVFSGLRRVPCIVEGIAAAIEFEREFGILHEPRVFEGVRGCLRLVQSLATEFHLRKNAKFILAIGRHGPSWFRLSGYDPKKIFPFAYFIDPLPVVESRAVRPGISVGYLGRLEGLKGADSFAASLSRLDSRAFVKIAGKGSLAASIEQVCALSPETREFLGAISMDKVPEFLSSIDILVTPSITTDDGWCVAVSEALLAGTFVISSNKVGASKCLEDGRGMILRRVSGIDIAHAINSAIAEEGLFTPSAREKRREWAQKHLSAEFGAELLSHIVNGVKRR